MKSNTSRDNKNTPRNGTEATDSEQTDDEQADRLMCDGGTRRGPPTDSGGAGPGEKIQQRRDDLQDIADSDLPAAWVAEALLDVADDDQADDRQG